jgi:hypothetical protein
MTRKNCPRYPLKCWMTGWKKEYKQLDGDRFEACRIWMRVWKTFKADYDLANRSIDEIDAQFNGSQSFFNWCQDFEMELINASIVSKEFAELGMDSFWKRSNNRGLPNKMFMMRKLHFYK